jgi:glyoxylase-like metal-dependent hydrolase (beta-lactamase superfamily II)
MLEEYLCNRAIALKRSREAVPSVVGFDAERPTGRQGGEEERMMAEAHVLSEGYARNDDRVGSTVGFVRDGDALVVIDPGMVPSRSSIVDPLAAIGVAPEQVTDVVISHHHPDHTLNVALFPNARLHDHWAWYRDDLWVSRDAEGFEISSGIRLIRVPGHTEQDVATLVDTPSGLWVFTHLWWTADGPAEDPYAPDPVVLHASRSRVLDLPGLATIVPGHGPAFVPGPGTPG